MATGRPRGTYSDMASHVAVPLQFFFAQMGSDATSQLSNRLVAVQHSLL